MRSQQVRNICITGKAMQVTTKGRYDYDNSNKLIPIRFNDTSGCVKQSQSM